MQRIVILFFALSSVVACGEASLSQVESEVFAPSCAFASCHVGASAAGGLNLEPGAYSRLVNVPARQSSKPLVDPGAPDNSYLMDKIRNRNIPTGDPMPPTDLLDQARIDLVSDWIAAGAPDN